MSRFEVGEKVLARFPGGNGEYHKAVVKKILKKDKLITVFFEFGTDMDLPFTHVKPATPPNDMLSSYSRREKRTHMADPAPIPAKRRLTLHSPGLACGSSAMDSPGTSSAMANSFKAPDPVAIVPLKDPPPPKDVSLNFNQGDLVIKWDTDHSNRCSYHVRVHDATNKLLFEERTEEMQYEISRDKLEPTIQYYATVSARNIDGDKESERVGTEKAMLCKRLKESNVYADKSSPLRDGYHVYVGYMKGQKNVCEKVAVKFVEDKFLREIETLVDLGSMENVVTYKYSGEIGEDFAKRAYIVMELCHEDNLYDMVQKGILKDQPEEVKKVLVHIMRGLSHIHERNILHRDLKPHNVLRSSNKKSMKICDFGLSKQMRDDQSKISKSGTDIGTEGWGSPEHYGDGKRMSKKSDIFSAGLIYCYVLSEGSHACGDDHRRWKMNIIDRKPICLPEFKCDEPVLAAELVSKMLQYDPNDRPSAAKVLSHPFFWSNDRKLDFTQYVSRFIQIALRKPIRHPVIQQIVMNLKELESNFSDWGQKILSTPDGDYLSKILGREITRVGKYKQQSVTDLIRFIRNLAQHYSEIPEFLQFFKKRANIWPFFSNLFPELLPKLFDIFNQHAARMGEIDQLSDVQEVLMRKAEYVSLKQL